MKKEINFGIGFVTGRPNVCKLINSFYSNMLEQINKYNKAKVKLTLYILFDLDYEYTIRTEFYNIIPDVYKNIKIKYITPEDIEEEKKKLISRHDIKREDADLFLGHGHAKGRNTVMYYALKDKIDYLLFWDDDEYPVASIKDETGEIIWKKQDNILKHLEYISDTDVTIGYHCGYISPIPYMDLGVQISEKDFDDYVEAVSNECVKVEYIKEKMKNSDGVTFASEEIASGEYPFELQKQGNYKWVAGSTLCLNLNNRDKIPAFYNPPLARGEDTFFSTLLGNSKIIKIPVYHFHDGFLKYTNIMKGNYPKRLRKIKTEEEQIQIRFLKASKGWIKYKPLLMYITDKENYKESIKTVYDKLNSSVPKMNEMFESEAFNSLLEELTNYDKNVLKHYKEYIRTNEIWNELKYKL